MKNAFETLSKYAVLQIKKKFPLNNLRKMNLNRYAPHNYTKIQNNIVLMESEESIRTMPFRGSTQLN